MNRTDTKFVFEYSLLEKVMEEIKAHYYVLDIDGVRLNATAPCILIPKTSSSILNTITVKKTEIKFVIENT